MKKILTSLVSALTITICLPLQAREAPILDYSSVFHPELSVAGMVASQEARATRVGADILEQGGNAVDAAVATGFALAVSLPRAGNLGGGGFMLIYLKDSNQVLALDYRETAPAAAHRDMFLTPEGEVDTELARFSHRSAGVPGSVAGLVHAQRNYGSLPLAQVMAPAIKMARDGLYVTAELASSLNARASRFEKSTAAKAIFVRNDGRPWEIGDRFVQSDLAWSLQQIATHGASAFYGGEVGQRLVADMEANAGLIAIEDLSAYQVREREPVRGKYNDFDIVSMPPPSSGGVHLIQMLNILDGYPLKDWGHNSTKTASHMIEAMRYAYADRSKYLGDPDFHDVPIEELLHKDYAALIRDQIAKARPQSSSKVKAGDLAPYESPDTTHFSVIDRNGNAVSNTYTLNFSFGSGIVAKGTGILLNNEMDDFSAKPGTPNAYGLIGGKANAIASGKRPLSSMTPTLVLRDGNPYLVTGSPGGSRIITIVLQTLLNMVEFDMNVAAATTAPRFHHQWLPDSVFLEPGFPVDTTANLRAMGYEIGRNRVLGSTHSVGWDGKYFYGYSDPRRPGGATIGVNEVNDDGKVSVAKKLK